MKACRKNYDMIEYRHITGRISRGGGGTDKAQQNKPGKTYLNMIVFKLV